MPVQTTYFVQDLLWLPHPGIMDAVRRNLHAATSGITEFRHMPEVRRLRFISELRMSEAPESRLLSSDSVYIDGTVAREISTSCPDGFPSSAPWDLEASPLVRRIWVTAYMACIAAAQAGEIRFWGAPQSENSELQLIRAGAMPNDISSAQLSGRLDFEAGILRLRSGETFFRLSLEDRSAKQSVLTAASERSFKRWLSTEMDAGRHHKHNEILQKASELGVSKKGAGRIKRNLLDGAAPETQKLYAAGRPKTKSIT